MTMMMMMIVDLYSALHRAPLLRYVSRCIVKRNVFSAHQKYLMLMANYTAIIVANYTARFVLMTATIEINIIMCHKYERTSERHL